MKKILTLLLAMLLVVGACFGLTACGEDENTLAYGKELVKADSQLDTLRLLDNGTIDVSIIDSVMAGYYCTTGAYKDKIKMLDVVLAEESYGIAGRKEDKAFVSKINEAIIALSDTEYRTVAEEYGLTSSLCVTNQTENPLANATDNSWNEIVASGKIIIGYTVFAPICYAIDNDVPTKGFDIDLAKKVAQYLNQTYSTNLTVEFVLIDWNTKETTLAQGVIDLIWNGMTITPERSSEMCVSIPYLKNFQSAVILKSDASKYQNVTIANAKEKFANAIMGAEAGSAGEKVITGK